MPTSRISKGKDGRIIVKLSMEFYERQAVFAAAHKLTDKFIVMIEPDDHTIGVYIEPKKNINLDNMVIDEEVAQFCNDLLDEQLRLDLDKQYGLLREMIVKQAFAPITSTELSAQLKETKN
jgi:His-Xaa-Ser system protein HxsD